MGVGAQLERGVYNGKRKKLVFFDEVVPLYIVKRKKKTVMGS